MNKEQLIKEIHKSFSDVLQPQKLSIDSSGDEPEAIEKFFRNRPWQDITIGDLNENLECPADSILSYMTHEAYRFFLPAFIVLRLEYPLELDAAGDFMIMDLCLPSYKNEKWSISDETFLLRVSGYNQKQKSLIAKFLEYEAEKTRKNHEGWYRKSNNPEVLTWSNDAQKALDSYWGQFLPQDDHE